MHIVLDKAARLLWQNRSRQGGTKLLVRARDIEASGKIVERYTTVRDHSKAIVLGSNGERYEVWFYSTGKVFCSCAFFQDLEPFQRQALGCKHLLAHAIQLVNQQRKCA